MIYLYTKYDTKMITLTGMGNEQTKRNNNSK